VADTRDRLFDQDGEPLHETFEFNQDVARVFDDMVSRSVPRYPELQSLLGDLALRCHRGLPIYDLGCSTGNTLKVVMERASEPLTLTGIDNSQAMLDHCREKLAPCLGGHTLHLDCIDIEQLHEFPHGPGGVVILSLVVQFLRPLRRQALLSMIHSQLAPGGCLLMIEKTMQRCHTMNALYIDSYHEFKRSMGYSALEIAKKREALENRLIPFQTEENMELLYQAGFAEASVFFTWLNFQGYIALKSETAP